MKKENRPDCEVKHRDIERLFELGLIGIQERGEAIHQIFYEEIALELDRLAKIKLEDEF